LSRSCLLAQVPGPFVHSLQQLAAAAADDPACVTWLLLVGNNGTMTLETLKAAVFSRGLAPPLPAVFFCNTL
jgi:hypothetical protein